LAELVDEQQRCPGPLDPKILVAIGREPLEQLLEDGPGYTVCVRQAVQDLIEQLVDICGQMRQSHKGNRWHTRPPVVPEVRVVNRVEVLMRFRVVSEQERLLRSWPSQDLTDVAQSE
jgi:hypothetical protein